MDSGVAMANPQPAAVSVADLQEWVRLHRVSWQASPEREVAREQDEPPGFELTLQGHTPGDHVPVDSDIYELVFDRLRSIALHALQAAPEAKYDIEPFDAAVHMSADESWAPEVELTLVLEAARDPSDAGRLREVLARVESGLEQLGVQRGHWHGR